MVLMLLSLIACDKTPGNIMDSYGELVDKDDDADGWSVLDGDCDDLDATINPDAAETWYDGVDQDCDGLSDYDSDFDGYDSALHGTGDDCDDTDATVFPGAVEICSDTIDQNCDGYDLTCPNIDLEIEIAETYAGGEVDFLEAGSVWMDESGLAVSSVKEDANRGRLRVFNHDAGTAGTATIGDERFLLTTQYGGGWTGIDSYFNTDIGGLTFSCVDQQLWDTGKAKGRLICVAHDALDGLTGGHNVEDLVASTGFIVEGLSDGEYFGASFVVGDYDDDGTDDLIIGSERDGDVYMFSGANWSVPGDPTGEAFDTSEADDVLRTFGGTCPGGWCAVDLAWNGVNLAVLDNSQGVEIYTAPISATSTPIASYIDTSHTYHYTMTVTGSSVGADFAYAMVDVSEVLVLDGVSGAHVHTIEGGTRESGAFGSHLNLITADDGHELLLVGESNGISSIPAATGLGWAFDLTENPVTFYTDHHTATYTFNPPNTNWFTCGTSMDGGTMEIGGSDQTVVIMGCESYGALAYYFAN